LNAAWKERVVDMAEAVLLIAAKGQGHQLQQLNRTQQPLFVLMSDREKVNLQN
jgi:hypothetical protein